MARYYEVGRQKPSINEKVRQKYSLTQPLLKGELNRYQCGGRGGGACESKLAAYRLDTPQAEERKPVVKSFDLGGMGSDRRTGSPKSAVRLQSDRWSLVTDRHWEMKRDAFLHPISKMLDEA
ncbi:hypothetical protein TNCV_3137061 [Trichonephila clavipes]|nr:hypothetical protein TNCV_3137061 [Trichonephila clavipes]